MNEYFVTEQLCDCLSEVRLSGRSLLRLSSPSSLTCSFTFLTRELDQLGQTILILPNV